MRFHQSTPQIPDIPRFPHREKELRRASRGFPGPVDSQFSGPTRLLSTTLPAFHHATRLSQAASQRPHSTDQSCRLCGTFSRNRGCRPKRRIVRNIDINPSAVQKETNCSREAKDWDSIAIPWRIGETGNIQPI